MLVESKDFQLTFANIPLVNLRVGFKHLMNFVDDLMENDDPDKRLNYSRLNWGILELDIELNHCMRYAIMGIECYIKVAVRDTLSRNRLWTEDVKAKINKPFYYSKKKDVYEVYYHFLPSLISEELSLKRKDNQLWARTKIFYVEVRNPMFHGCEAHELTPQGLKNFCDHIAGMYHWIDGWFELEF